MEYSIEEQLKIIAALEEFFPAGADKTRTSGLIEDELNLDDLSMVTAAQGLRPEYQNFLRKVKGER